MSHRLTSAVAAAMVTLVRRVRRLRSRMAQMWSLHRLAGWLAFLLAGYLRAPH